MTGITFAFLEILIEHTGWVLLHSVWQFSAIASLVFVANRLLQKASATARYVLLLAGLFLMTATPAVTWFVLPKPADDVAHVVPMAEVTSGFPGPHDVLLAYADLPASLVFDSHAVDPPLVVDRAVAAPVTVSADKKPISAWFERLAEFLQPWLSTIVMLWCSGVLLFSIRPLWSWLNVCRLRKVGTSPVAESVREALQRIAERLQVTRRVEILASAVVSSPIVVGCFRSVILLPASFIANVPASQLEAIIAHELAHVRRHDYLVNLLQTLIETMFFYHPAVWWLSHCIRIERENCCDDLVVSTFGNRADYGRALLAVEEFRTAAALSKLALSANGGSLLNRVRRLVDTSGANHNTNSAGAAALAILTLGLAIAAIWFTSTSHAADDKPVEKSGLDAVITDEVPPRECINLRGICRNEKDEALEGVWIRVYGGRAGAGRMDKTAEVVSVATDREGKFHVTAQMPPFLRDLSADSVGFVAVFSLNRGSSVVMKSWSGAAIDDNLDVTLSGSPFTLRGTVLDEKGKPIQGAALFVRNGLNVDIPASHNGLTNVEGQFEIPGLQREEAKRFLCVYHPDYGQKQVLHQYNNDEITD